MSNVIHSTAPTSSAQGILEVLRLRHERVRWVGALAVEILAMGGLFLLYRQIRHLTSGDLATAMANADQIVDLERRLGVFTERDVQELVLRSRLVIDVLDHYYVLVHFPLSIGFLLWAFTRHRAAYGRIRAWFLGVTVSGLVIHVLYPLAPPRMLTQHGFVDTLSTFGPDIYSDDVTASTANQLAAMPSLHFAWAALVAAGIITTLRSRWRFVALLHPAVTLLAIVATANHYWADAAVGGLLVAGSILVVAVVARVRARSVAPDHVPHASSPAPAPALPDAGAAVPSCTRRATQPCLRRAELHPGREAPLTSRPTGVRRTVPASSARRVRQSS
jgi:hypothetical protein